MVVELLISSEGNLSARSSARTLGAQRPGPGLFASPNARGGYLWRKSSKHT